MFLTLLTECGTENVQKIGVAEVILFVNNFLQLLFEPK
jgi:hypothetical protein